MPVRRVWPVACCETEAESLHHHAGYVHYFANNHKVIDIPLSGRQRYNADLHHAHKHSTVTFHHLHKSPNMGQSM